MTEQMTKALDLLEHCCTHRCLDCEFATDLGFHVRCTICNPKSWDLKIEDYAKYSDGWHRREEATHDL